MDREEILSKIREENGGTDEREQQIRLKGEALAKRIGAAMCFFLVLLEEILTDQAVGGFAAFSIYFAMQTVDYVYRAVQLKEKKQWIGAAVCGVFTAAMLTVFVLMLCKVV